MTDTVRIVTEEIGTGKERHMAGSKKVIGSALLCAMALCMTACGNQIPDLTEDESQRIGEYAAVTLLKYDANNRSRLVDPDVVIAKLEKEAARAAAKEEEQKTETTDGENTTEIETPAAQQDITTSLEEFFGFPEGVTLSYEDYQVTDSYPEDGSTADYFALDASTGKKLVVLRFRLANSSAQDESIDLLDSASRYVITVNDSIRGNALPTMLPNDMSTYVDTLTAGAEQELVLLMEVNEETANDIHSISLRLKNASNEYTIQLL